MNTEELKELQHTEAGTACRWRTIEAGYNWKTQQGWFKGKWIKRTLSYGTLGNPHAPSKWRVSGYTALGVDFDFFKDALAHACK